METLMRRDLMDILACPTDKATLQLKVEKEEKGEVVTGSLTCTKCKTVYPVTDGIPNLLPAHLRG